MRYQIGYDFHAGSPTAPFNAFTPQGTCELAMKSALACGTSAANDSRNFSLFKPRKPSPAGSMGGTGAPGTGSLISEFTDSPLSGANEAMYTRPATFPGWVAMTRLVAATSSARDVVGFWTMLTL